MLGLNEARGRQVNKRPDASKKGKLDSPVRRAREGSSLSQDGQEKVDDWSSEGSGVLRSSMSSASVGAELEGDEFGSRSRCEVFLVNPFVDQFVLVVLVLRRRKEKGDEGE